MMQQLGSKRGHSKVHQQMLATPRPNPRALGPPAFPSLPPTSLAASSSVVASSFLVLRLASSARFSSGGLPSNTKLRDGCRETEFSVGALSKLCSQELSNKHIKQRSGSRQGQQQDPLTPASCPLPACAQCGRTCLAGGCVWVSVRSVQVGRGTRVSRSADLALVTAKVSCAPQAQLVRV